MVDVHLGGLYLGQVVQRTFFLDRFENIFSVSFDIDRSTQVDVEIFAGEREDDFMYISNVTKLIL